MSSVIYNASIIIIIVTFILYICGVVSEKIESKIGFAMVGFLCIAIFGGLIIEVDGSAKYHEERIQEIKADQEQRIQSIKDEQ